MLYMMTEDPCNWILFACEIIDMLSFYCLHFLYHGNSLLRIKNVILSGPFKNQPIRSLVTLI